MIQTLIRGRVLSFRSEPMRADDLAACLYEEDGAVLVEEGRIAAVGAHDAVSRQVMPNHRLIDHRPYLLLPGLIDAHAHFPQMRVIASFGAELLDWLENHTFPEEGRFDDPVLGRRIAVSFIDELVRNGTTSAAIFCTSRPESVAAFFAEARRRAMRVVAGKVMMDANAPADVSDTAQSSYDDSRALIETWHGRDRLHYAVTPRFAITSSPAQLEAAGALLREFPDLHMQTHLSENQAEIALAQKLYPDARDYTDIYHSYGLTGPKSLFGHCLHLSEREADALSQSGSVAVFCPTSNLFLGSGLFDYHRYRTRSLPLRIAAGTDVGGGTSYSMLRTMGDGYKVIALQGEKLNPLAAFWQITRGNAEALSLAANIGTLEPGSDADLVVLNARATSAMALRMERVEQLADELFVLQTLGDDRAIVETYIAGVPAKSSLQPEGTGLDAAKRLSILHPPV